MRNAIWTATLVACAVTSPLANAREASKEEAIGVGSGALVGALAGGPVGFIIGSAIGARLGDNWHEKNAEMDSLSASLSDSGEQIEELQVNVLRQASRADAASAELERLERTGQPQAVRLLQAGIESDWLFRTDEYVLAQGPGERLNAFARKLAGQDNINVRLDGYADPRGDSDYNQALSEKRTEYVRQQLVAAGIDDARISTVAHGEVDTGQADSDSLALERRVSMKVFVVEDSALAAVTD